MPPIDPNDRPIFLDPSDREPIGPYTGMAQEPLNSPAFSQQQIDLAAALRPHMETLSSLTAQMAHNFEGINELLESNADHLDVIGSKQQRNARLTTDEFARQKQIRDTTEERARIMDRINTSERKSSDSLMQQFRSGGMIRRGQIEYLDKQGKLASTTLEQYQQMDETQRRNIREQLASNLQQRQGQDTQFSLNQAIQHLAHGQIGSAVGELMQGLPFTQGITSRLQTSGEARMARGATQLAEGSTIRGGANMGLGALVGRGIPYLFTPASLYLAQREIRQSIQAYQTDLRQGMQGGLQGNAAVRESVGANVRARIEGINPFDALTTQMAQQIAAGIQSEGFTGAIRSAWQDSVTDVVKSTGVDAGTALQLMSTSANQLGESANQFRQDMNLVENAAKNTNLSVTQLAQNMQQLQQSMVATGGAPAAAPASQLSNLLANALGGQGAIGRAGLPGILAAVGNPQAWQLMVARAGISPLLATARATLNQAAPILDQLGNLLWQQYRIQGQSRGMSLHTWVVMMSTAQAFQAILPGADENAVEAFMLATRNGGLERTQARTSAQNAPEPVKAHRGLFGSIYHGITSAAHSIETGLNAPANAASAAIRAVGGEFMSDKNARNLAEGLTDKFKFGDYFGRTKVYEPINMDVSRQQQISYWRDQAMAMGLSATQTRNLLDSTRQATSATQLEQANVQAQTIIVKLHPQAARYLTAEPSNVQRYWDSVYGKAGSQYSERPPGGSR